MYRPFSPPLANHPCDRFPRRSSGSINAQKKAQDRHDAGAPRLPLANRRSATSGFSLLRRASSSRSTLLQGALAFGLPTSKATPSTTGVYKRRTTGCLVPSANLKAGKELAKAGSGFSPSFDEVQPELEASRRGKGCSGRVNPSAAHLLWQSDPADRGIGDSPKARQLVSEGGCLS
jgi:hypothetical protein